MGSEKMATEKTPALCNIPSECDNQKERFCSRSTWSWILAAALISLLLVVTIQFSYSPFEQRIRIYEDEPIRLRIIPSSIDVSSSGEKYEENDKKPWDFDFLIDPSNLCATFNPPNSVEYEMNPEVKLLILVSSAEDHFEQRTAIRNTWGSVAEKPFGPMRLGFVLGTTSNKTVDELVSRESLEYKDIIQVDAVDTYQPKMTKTILMLKWVTKRCPHAQFFLKADDHTFVNIGAIANILSSEPYVSQDKFIAGYVQQYNPPLSPPQTQQKFQLSIDAEPLNDYYPTYASGSSYVMSIPTAIELFDAAQVVPPLMSEEEDAFLTGECAQHIDAPLIHEPSFVIQDPPMPPSWDSYSKLATAHGVSPDILEQVWNDMTLSISDTTSYFETAINESSNRRKKVL